MKTVLSIAPGTQHEPSATSALIVIITAVGNVITTEPTGHEADALSLSSRAGGGHIWLPGPQRGNSPWRSR